MQFLHSSMYNYDTLITLSVGLQFLFNFETTPPAPNLLNSNSDVNIILSLNCRHLHEYIYIRILILEQKIFKAMKHWTLSKFWQWDVFCFDPDDLLEGQRVRGGARGSPKVIFSAVAFPLHLVIIYFYLQRISNECPLSVVITSSVDPLNRLNLVPPIDQRSKIGEIIDSMDQMTMKIFRFELTNKFPHHCTSQNRSDKLDNKKKKQYSFRIRKFIYLTIHI